MTLAAPRPVRRHGAGMLASGCALAALIVALVHPPYARAEGPEHRAGGIDVSTVQERARDRFADLDRDGDGLLSETELADAPPPHWRMAPAGHRRGPHPGPDDEPRAGLEDDVFARLDADGSGALERDEFSHGQLRETMRATLAAQRFKRLDADADGRVSEAEFVAQIADLDKDGDGLLERGEWHPHRKPH